MRQPTPTAGAASRIACVLVPALPLHAVLRAQPALRGQPLAVLTPEGRVLHASAEAAGVTPGMTAAQARAACSAVQLHSPAAAVLAAASDALADVAAAFSPQVEQGPDHALLAVGDLRLLYPAEDALAAALHARASELELPARVALAGSTVAARLLARARPGVTVVPPGEDAAALAALPIAALDPAPALAAALQRWGVATLGAFAALPRKALGARLGTAGVRLHRQVHGEDLRPLQPTPPPDILREALALEDELSDQEALAFVLRGLLDRLVQRLALRSLACGDFQLHLDLGPRSEVRTIAVATPTRDTATLLKLARLHLETRPPQAPVRGVSVSTQPERRPVEQLQLLAPPGPRPPGPERLMTALAQLQALCGEHQVGVPQRSETHLPGAVQRRPFPRQAPLVSETASEAPPALLAGRAVRPPRRVSVDSEGDAPTVVRGPGLGKVRQRGGPYHLRAGLAGRARPARLYYDVELESGALARLYREGDAWFLDAYYE